MNIELSKSLEQRAAKHAALSDPARLHIVDLLALSDQSSMELQSTLGISSNLLAHHLRVLEEQRIVVRSRSQGDRRRSYVHLLRGSLEGINSGGSASARRVVFVCTANSARSQLAAALWRQNSDIPVASAGTHPAEAIDPRAIAAAARHQLAVPIASPQSIIAVIREQDLIVTVCDSAHEEMHQPDAIHWSVPDPVLVGTAAAFDAAYDDIALRITELAPHLTAA